MGHTQARIRRGGFTLIELLVVIAIIALLIGILLPALGSVRKEARAATCAANARTVAQAVQTYVTSYDYYPPAYVYGDSQTGGTWRLQDQLFANPNPANGYVHWSYALLSDDEAIPENAFKCPAAPKGGAPATNPGASAEDWEPMQINDMGQTTPSNVPKDRQARRMAYTGNAAIFPRNKFYVSGHRKNQLVRDGRITFPFKTILATEFLHLQGDWRSISDNNVSKSHRAVTPFLGGSAGAEVYNEPDIGGVRRFFYPSESEILPESQLGPNMIRDGNSVLNAVGRSHPSPDKRIGGSANFSFVDGHVERMTVLESVKKKLWGDQFYSLTGRNTRVDMDGF
jgi:prepilin-type N-terminal cleavage/methylation domain-containing protein/prepilin-type processing-associated H-X9-DG protein